MKRHIILVLFAILATCAYGSDKKTIQGTPFTGRDYTILFPATWDVSHGLMGTDVIGFSPLEDSNDEFRENVNVVLENIPDSMTVEKFLSVNLSNMIKALGLPPTLQFSTVTIGHVQAYHVRYSGIIFRREMDNDLYIVVDNKSAYSITCSNEKGKRVDFKKVEDSIIATFKLR